MVVFAHLDVMWGKEDGYLRIAVSQTCLVDGNHMSHEINKPCLADLVFYLFLTVRTLVSELW